MESDFGKYGAFHLVPGDAGNILKIRHVSGCEISWLGGPLSQDKIIRNHEEEAARIMNIENDMESPILRLFTKVGQAQNIQKYAMVKCIKDQPLDPDTKMERAKKGPTSACSLLNRSSDDVPPSEAAPAPLMDATFEG